MLIYHIFLKLPSFYLSIVTEKIKYHNLSLILIVDHNLSVTLATLALSCYTIKINQDLKVSAAVLYAAQVTPWEQNNIIKTDISLDDLVLCPHHNSLKKSCFPSSLLSSETAFNLAVVGRSQKYRSLIISSHGSVLTPPSIRHREARMCGTNVPVNASEGTDQVRRTH